MEEKVGRRDAEGADSAEAQESQGMEKRELDVGIAVGALQPCPCTIIMRAAGGSEEGKDRVSL